jgi:MinD superfamily P-loop ATPase
MIVAVASGKGGTGKTSVAVNMAFSIENVQLLDCDVEEPNAHLFCKIKLTETEPVYTLTPVINHELCNYCGKCSSACQYNAVFVTSAKSLVFPDLCHSCGACEITCPKKAITWEKHKIGEVKTGTNDDFELVYGELQVGKPLAVPIIKAVKKKINHNKTAIIDSPPGTSCTFVEAVKGSDFCILVTEPTPFGLHDLSIAVQVLRTLKIPFGVVINRAGLGDTKVYDYCKQENISVLLEIPYQRHIAEFYSQGIPFSLEMTEWKNKFQQLEEKITEALRK